MQTILDILKSAGGWHPGLSLTIDNTPYMPLVIEALDESGPCGLPALSVAHYGELMRDPEMCFELSFAGGEADLNPFYYRNDYVGCEQWSRFLTGTDYAYHRELHRQHVSFAKVCDHNLHSQGFAEAFRKASRTVKAGGDLRSEGKRPSRPCHRPGTRPLCWVGRSRRRHRTSC